jgi:hypothetical protein
MKERQLGSKRIAIMQPYFFPYMGYFSLVKNVDQFIFLDDVNFPKKGWVNRNILIINGDPRFFTIPLEGQSQNKLINEIKAIGIEDFSRKFLKTIELKFRKYPYFQSVFDLISKSIAQENCNISDIAMRSVVLTSNYLGLDTIFSVSSQNFCTHGLFGQDKIIETCRQSGATCYVNAEGGKGLYQQSAFLKCGINLEFDNYSQRACFDFFKDGGHVVSAIGALMKLAPEQIRAKLGNELS